jgi:2OG-Fe dioxygenase
MTKSFFVHEVGVVPAKHFSLRGAVSSSIRVFHLADLGINSEDFLARIGPTFHGLPLDPYDPSLVAERLVKERFPDVYRAHEADWLLYWNKLANLQYTNPLAGPQFWNQRITNDDVQKALSSIRPHRRRSCFQYLARPHSSAEYRWELQEVGTPTFAQAVTDVRARPRRFATSPMSVYRDGDILSFIGITCQLVRQTASVLATTMRVTLHQMLTYADNPAGREPAPEGTHQDGSPFIVSALVIERHNVVGGVSRIYYTKDDGLALEHELRPGYGILQSDTHHEYWHQVTAVYPLDPTKIAYRSILGLDIDFVDKG